MSQTHIPSGGSDGRPISVTFSHFLPGTMAAYAHISFSLLFAFLRCTVTATCSFDNCGQDDNATYVVHIVPHSHMDLGWLKTVQQYFHGTNGKVNNIAVKLIYDSVVSELLTDKSKRFIFVETGFFELWWNHSSDASRESFRELLNNGQIEFISGGYVMNDEAATYYTNTIDQMTLGLGILKSTFGECGVSRIGWQIDPFGHSREFASLLSQMNFNGLFLGRIDYQDKNRREETRTMEFKWQASDSLPQTKLTGVVLANNYSPPPGFCFDIYCNDDPLVEDKESEEYNLPDRVKDLMTWIETRAAFFATNNFLITMGNDFNYHSAHKWMSNIDILIRYVNSRADLKINGLPVRFKYSTPSCYMKAIQGAKLATKTDDFFPYSSDSHAFWTGYFTSRPAFKYLDRVANNLFQAGKQLAAMAGLGSNRLTRLSRALAIAQHHDAITGTAKQFVNDEYTRSTLNSFDEARDAIAEAFTILGDKDAGPLFFCKSLNISECDDIDGLISSEGIAVNAYNPSSQEVVNFVRVPIADAGQMFDVTGSQGEYLKYDILPIPKSVLSLPERSGKATHEIVIPIEIGSHDFTSVSIKPRKNSWASEFPSDVAVLSSYRAFKLGRHVSLTERRGDTEVVIDPKKGVTRISVNGASVNISAGYFYYESHDGDNHDFDHRASGAYIFRPNVSTAVPLPRTSQEIVRGQTVTEIRNTYTDWLSDVMRITDRGEVEVDWVIGPIPVDDNIGKEIIWRLDTDIDSRDKFYTDSNGRETLERTRNFRPTWDVSLEEPVAGNYYPVNSRISIKNQNVEAVVLTDRSVGGSSLRSGQIEIMLHRRCLHDDAFGVGEALNEPGSDGKGLRIRGTHTIVVHKIGEFDARSAAINRALKPIVVFSTKPLNASQSRIDVSALPATVQLLSLEQISPTEFLLRLENKVERSAGGFTATVDLFALFRNRVAGVRETFLAANIDRKTRRGTICTVRLQPMEIRTFVVTLN